MSDNPLNAQQLQAIRNEASAALQAAVDRMQLRKWAVEQAFASINSPYMTITDGRPIDPMDVAAAIYDFVSQSAVVKVDIGQ
jgi:hypothetical protein